MRCSNYRMCMSNVGLLAYEALSEDEAAKLYGNKTITIENGVPTLVFDTESRSFESGESIKLALPAQRSITGWYTLLDESGNKYDLSTGFKVKGVAESYLDVHFLDSNAFGSDAPVWLLRNVIVSHQGKQAYAEITFNPQLATHILILDDSHHCVEASDYNIPECLTKHLHKRTEREEITALGKDEMLFFSVSYQTRGAHFLTFDNVDRYYVLPYDFMPTDEDSRDEAMKHRRYLFNQFLVSKMRFQQHESHEYSFEVGI